MVQQVPSQKSSSPESSQPSQDLDNAGLGSNGRKFSHQRSPLGDVVKPRSRRQRRQRDRSQLANQLSSEGQKSSPRQSGLGRTNVAGMTGRSASGSSRPLPDRSSSRSRMRVVSNQDSVPSSSESSEPQENNLSARKPQSTSPSRGRSRTGKRSKSATILLYILRLLILGIGIGVLAGTLLMSWDPSVQSSSQSGNRAPTERVTRGKVKSQQSLTPEPIALSQTIAPLTGEINKLAAQTPNLSPFVFLVDVDTAAYVDIDGAMPIPAASTIKLPILVAFFQDLDAGKLHLNEALTMRSDLMADESGEMRNQPAGTQFSAWETALKMIVISDNTATNMLIERLGGADALNRRFKSWGLTETAINNPLPDLKGTNTTSARDLANLLSWINQGKLVSLRSRDHLLGIMQRTETNTLLPRGLGEGAIIAHKTGDIGSILGDVGIIDLPNGKSYIISVFVKRPHNDAQARTLIQNISRAVYNHFTLAPSQAETNPSPAGDTNTSTNSDSFTDSDQSTPVGSANSPSR